MGSNPNDWSKLAKEIACRAVSSRAAGGPGKVMMINFSIGGLAAKFAAAQVVNDRKVVNDIGYMAKAL